MGVAHVDPARFAWRNGTHAHTLCQDGWFAIKASLRFKYKDAAAMLVVRVSLLVTILC